VKESVRCATLRPARHRLDPSFCPGYRAVGGDYDSLGQSGRASEYYTKAFQLRDRASEREKLDIAAHYYTNITGELEKAAQTYQQRITKLPAVICSVWQSGQRSCCGGKVRASNGGSPRKRTS